MSKPIRVTVLMKRRDKESPEEFRKYWAETHGPKFLSVSLVEEHLVRYQRFYSSSELVSIANMRKLHLPSLSIQDEFDGAAEFWAPSMEDLEAVFSSQEYYEKVYLDENNFLDREKSRTLIGYEEVDIQV
ncbi:hypothetical protein E8E11_008079 [Didymella keratinophila]|nr:hypothetical protein E8E11_008079 [Didymella keratinophila]